MGSESPNVILYDVNGQEMSVSNGVAIPSGTSGLMILGSDGTNSRFITLDTSGRQLVVGAGTAGTPTGGVVSIQGVSGGTAIPVSGTVTANNASVSTTAAAVPTSATFVGGAVQTLQSGLTTGDIYPLSLTTAGLLRVDGSNVTQPISGTVTANAGTGNFAVVQATAANLNATVVASGNFNNASIGATAASPPTSATYMGGSVTTTSPTYTNGQMDPLSLTTAGALRIDGSAVTQPVSGTVTANAGTGTFTVAGTVTSNQGTANTLANAWSTKITDATNGPVAVKAASTAAVATDPALVVALSPNNPITLSQNDTNVTGSLTALGSSVSINTQGTTTLIVEVTGTWVGTIFVQISLDNGATYTGALTSFNQNTFYLSGITTNGYYYVATGGARMVRLYMNAYTSGTANIVMNAGTGAQYNRLLAFNTDGTNVAAVKGANTAPLTTDPALVVTMSPNFEGGSIPVSLYPSGAQDVQGNAVTISRITQITNKFYQQAPSAFLNITTSGGATATQGTGTNIGAAVFSTGTAATADVTGMTFATVSYATQYEVFACISAKFTTPTSAASYQRTGIYNSTDGFSFGYNGTTFGIWTRFNGTDTFIAQTAWNKDTLSGAAGSYFTNSGSPTSLVTTDFNMYRIRYAWYGSTPVYFEVMSPDGQWVLVHLARFSNVSTTVSITQPDLPMTVDVSKTASDATNLTVAIGAMSAGVSAPPTGPIVTGIQTISALNGELILPVLTQSSFSFSISGTWVGTLAFNYSLDGVTFTPDNVLNNSTGAIVTSTTINNAYTANVGSYKYYQIIATAWTSGTATITYNGSGATNIVTALSLITDANNHGPVAVKAASTAAATTDSALVVALSPATTPTNTVAGSPALLVQNSENTRQTYSIGIENFPSATTNQDVFCLIGSATQVVRLTRIIFSMTATTAVTIPVQLLKRSTLNTGGTSGVAGITPHDSNNAAATATNIAYVTNQATNGTIVGTMIRSQKYFAQVSTPTSECQIIDWQFGQNGSQPPTLRSATTELCINLGGVTIAGGSVSAIIEWTEDSN